MSNASKNHHKGIISVDKKYRFLALAGMSQWIESGPANQSVACMIFPVRVHAWVAGQVPCRGHMRDNHTLMFLSFSFSLSSPLFKNKRINLLKKSIDF